MTSIKRREFLLDTTKAIAGAMLLAGASIAPAKSNHLAHSDSIKQILTGSEVFTIDGFTLRNAKEIIEIYAARNYAPLWSTEDISTKTSKAISKKLLNSQQLGLEPTKYLGRLLHQLATNSLPDQMLQFELALTDSLLSYFKDLAHGALKTPPSDSGWKQRKSKPDSKAIISNFFKGNISFTQTIRELQPDHTPYLSLIEALNQHQAMISTGGWPRVPGGKTLQPGDTSPRIAILRARLLASGDLSYTGVFDPNEFDSTVVNGLIAFQYRHGLETDGILGSKTLAQLNTSLDTRIAQLQANIDRWRWLPRDMGNANITVNTAGYDLVFSVGGAAVSRMKVVVGKPDKKTPVFSDSMKHLVFNPSWYVPKSIVRELLPKEARKPGWFKRNNFEIRNRSDNKIASPTGAKLKPDYFVSTYRLRQLPGGSNAMGDLKFMFPNRYQIYLHDTNARSLFSKAQRAFSHGCVRVEKPTDLAKQLLIADGKSAAEIDNFLAAKSTKKVNLQTHVPVHLTYQTAWVDDSGLTHFRGDIYDHDKHALAQIRSTRIIYAEAELEALASTGLTLVSNMY